MSDTQRCEPPEHLRGVDGWHWVKNAIGREAPIRWNASVVGWWDDPVPIGPQYAYEAGYRYVGPAPPPSTVAALVEMLDLLAGFAESASTLDFNEDRTVMWAAVVAARARAALALYRGEVA